MFGVTAAALATLGPRSVASISPSPVRIAAMPSKGPGVSTQRRTTAAATPCSERLEKVWEIQNVGSVEWEGRHLRRVGASSGPGRLTTEPLTPVPRTAPGQICLIRLTIEAPRQPGTYYAAWKMVGAGGNEILAKQSPLFVSVDVVDDASLDLRSSARPDTSWLPGLSEHDLIVHDRRRL